jgi:hypothetical protein
MGRQAGGRRVLTAQGALSEQDFPFSVVDQLFTGKLDDRNLDDMHAALRHLARHLRNLAPTNRCSPAWTMWTGRTSRRCAD